MNLRFGAWILEFLPRRARARQRGGGWSLELGGWNSSIRRSPFRARCLHAALSCLLVLTACDHSVQIGPDYKLAPPDSSSSTPGKVLLYRGRSVWPRVLAGSEKSLHNGVFVFAAPVPDETGNVDFGDSTHLYAIRGEGPAVLISERIYGQPRDGSWQVKSFEAEAAGITVEFGNGRGSTNLAPVTREATWADIERWLLEAQGASEEKVTPLATYRVLLFKSATNDSSINGAQPLDNVKGLGEKP